jgi:membrane protein DedA with SNARE-associated domain
MGLIAFIGLFAAVVATWVAVSGPGEAALIGAGGIAARGDTEIVLVVAIAFAGTIVGNALAYWLGRAGGRRLLLGDGPFLERRARAVARTEALAHRRSFIASLLSPGWLAGITEIPVRPFVAGSAVSGLAWALTIGLGTFYVGPSLISVYDSIGNWLFIAALSVLITVAVLFLARGAGRRLASR